MTFRTDRNNNPTAFTTDIAHQAGLKLGLEYEKGEPFVHNAQTFHTARLLGDPIALTLKVINTIGFFTKGGALRWNYIGIPKELWDDLDYSQQKFVIGLMYKREGGTQLVHLFEEEKA